MLTPKRKDDHAVPLRVSQNLLLWLVSLDVHQQIFLQPSSPLLEPLNFRFETIETIETIETLDDLAVFVTKRIEAWVCRH